MLLTMALSVAAGMAFRRRVAGSAFLFRTAIASLMLPSIVTPLGIALEFRLVDDFIQKVLVSRWQTGMGPANIEGDHDEYYAVPGMLQRIHEAAAKGASMPPA